MNIALKTACSAAIVALATAGTQAVADPVNELFFTQDAGWVDPLISFDGSAGNIFQGFSGATGAGAPADTWETMAWSGTDEAVQSSITLSTFTDASSLVRVDELLAPDLDGEWNAGDWWQITNLTQTNRGLAMDGDVPNPLWIADTLANLRIFGDDAHSDLLLEDLESSAVIEFWETFNEEGCPDSPSPLSTTCDDIFRVVESDFAALSFDMDGYEYTIEFVLFPGPSTDAGGGVIGESLVCPNEADPRCDEMDVPEGEVWVATPEFNPGTSSINILMRWTAEKIPEPAMLSLLGIGILGMGFAGRRRKHN